MDSVTVLAQQLGDRLTALKAQIAVAESCTGGGVAEAITRIAGSSAWFEAACITYSNAQKVKLLGVSSQLLIEQGAVSAAVAVAMAQGIQHRAVARFAVATTGIAGPTGALPDLPVGSVWIAWVLDEQSYVRLFCFEGDRQAVRQQAVEAALEGIIALCDALPPSGSQRFLGETV